MLYRVSFNKIGAEYTRCFTDRAERDKFAEDMRKAGIDYAIRQILDLKQHGVDGIHIYSMNKPKTTRMIVEAIR